MYIPFIQGDLFPTVYIIHHFTTFFIKKISYRITFFHNVFGQTHYTSESSVRYFFMKKVVKWCIL